MQTTADTTSDREAKLEAPTSASVEIVTESIVRVDRPAAGSDSYSVALLGTDGREKSLPCSEAVAHLIVQNSYTHNKNRTYRLVTDAAGKVTTVVPGAIRVPRGLKLATLAHNSEPASAVVLRRDCLGGGEFSNWAAVKSPMGLGQARIEEIITRIKDQKTGDPVAHGYSLFRRIEQSPGQEFLVLTK